MTPVFAITAIRAAIRIGTTAADAFEQYAQERPVLLPDVEREGRDATLTIRAIAKEFPEFAQLLESDADLALYWQDSRPTQAPGAEAAVFAAAIRFEKRGRGGAALGATTTPEEIAGGAMVGQWAQGKGPVSPWARVVVAMTDVALEYLGAHPEVVGIGGEGEKLVGAIAAAIAEAIPDGETRAELGPSDRFAERLAALALHAGLKTIAAQPGLVVRQDHLQALLKNVLTPVVAALPPDVTSQVRWRDTADALMGPAVNAALNALAANPARFLGKRFEADKAAGALIYGMLQAAQRQDVESRFSREGLVAILEGALGVAAEHPALILGDLFGKDLTDAASRDAAETIAVDLFGSVAKTLAGRKAPFGEGLGVAVAVAAIEGLRASAPAVARHAGSWSRAVETVTGQILEGFELALTDADKDLGDTVFSEAGLIGLARVFVDEVAAAPHLLVGAKHGDLARVVKAVATAMAADGRLLLTAEDWKEIAAVAAEEAALNPGRLFGLNAGNPTGLLAAELIGGLLKTAADAFGDPGRQPLAVLAGDTLKEAVIVTLRAVAGNVDKAAAAKSGLAVLVGALNDLAAEQPLAIGGKEWSRLFRALLPKLLADGAPPEIDPAKIEALLASIQGGAGR